MKTPATRILPIFFLLLLAVPAFGAEKKLKAPPVGQSLRVAFIIANGANVADHAGPWEVFQDVELPDGKGGGYPGFQLYTVSNDAAQPIRATGGLLIVPHYTFENAPEPDIVVIGAQGAATPALKAWLLRQATRVDVVLGVCTGVTKLADVGLLDGKVAATHHAYVDSFNARFPKVKFVKGKRYVQSDETIITAGGITSGIDGALHVVARYFGEELAGEVAAYMEYQGNGWKTGDS
jgi:transcriptional regulator GlxA family with amidase domain